MVEEKKFQTGNILLIAGAHFVHDVYSSFLSPVLPLLIEKLKLSYTLAGLLTVAQNLPSLFNPLVGVIADKISVRYLLIIAPLITAISMSFLGAAPSYTVLIILLFIMGISASMFHVPAPVMVKHIAGNRIGKGMSIFMLGGEVARGIGPLVILAGISLWGLEGTYRLIPFGLIASVFLFFKFKKIQISDELKNQKTDSELLKTFKANSKVFVNMSGILFFTLILKSALTAFLPTYLSLKGESLWMAGASLAVLQFAGGAGTFFSGTISDRIGRKTTMMIMAVTVPILMAGFLLLSGVFIIPILIILGLFLFATNPVLLAELLETKSDRLSFLNGIYMTLNFLIASLTTFLIGMMSDLIGMEKTYFAATILSVFSIPFILRLSNNRS
ncbi:MAG: MFS transporter [Ignavibacteriaceae bacterium]|jgi:FSR family fosmidomycin resistance protein-like MFS transporter